MPMIDVFAPAGTLANKRELMKALNAAIMKWEKVPPLRMFSDNTACFIHEMPKDSMADANGAANHIRVQIMTPSGVLDREKKLGVVKDVTDIVVGAAGDPSLKDRTWVQIAEAPDGGWGMAGHAYTNAEITDAARRELGRT